MEKYLEKYPTKIVCLTVILTVISYLLGTLILYTLHIIPGILFFFLCVFTIIISMKLRCCYCCYYGKRCGTGLGIPCNLFFKKGDPQEFKDMKKIIPTAILSFGTLLIPILCSIILLAIDFSFYNIALLVIYLLIGFLPNFFLRGSICETCKQSELGCPTYDQMTKKR